MKRIAIAAAVMILAGPASATCFGTGAFQTCSDTRTGNNYTIQRYGNTTTMQGYNTRTGSRWSQNSYTYGNNTQHHGRDSNGNRWSTNCFNGVCY